MSTWTRFTRRWRRTARRGYEIALFGLMVMAAAFAAVSTAPQRLAKQDAATATCTAPGDKR